MANFVRVLCCWFPLRDDKNGETFTRRLEMTRKNPHRLRTRIGCASKSGGLLTCIVTVLCLALLTPITVRGAEDDDQDAERTRQKQIVAKFMTVLEKNPRRGTALDRVYGHHVEWGTLDEFVSSLKKKTQTNQKDAASWMLLGLMEAQRGRDAEAIDGFRQAEAEAPKNALASYYLGLSLNLIGQPEEAVAALERAIERKPAPADLLEIYQQLGRMHQRAQRNDQALQVWSRLESEFPNDVRVQEQIAIALLEDGRTEEALPRYEALAKRTKDDYRRTVFLIQAAELKVKLNKRDEGLRELEKTMADLNPDSWLHRDIRRRVEDIFLRSGDQDGLVAYYEKWIAAHPEDVDGMARLGRFLARSARVPEATTWLDRALKLAPTRKELRIAFIDQLVDDQRFAEAAQQYELLDKSDPNNPDYLRDWGRMILRDKQRPKDERTAAAEAIWNRLAESKPNDPLIAAQVADLFRHQEITEPALKLYRRAVDLAPDEPQYREYLGEYLHLLKRPDEALNVWREIVAGKRRNVTNVARLAEVLNNHGFQDEALKYMADACELDSKDFSLQLKSAEYHSRASQYPAAFQYIAAAEKLAANDEERETVLNDRIKVLQSSQTLDDEIDALVAKIESKPSARDWYVIARYYEADRRQPESVAAIEKSLQLDPKSVTSLTAAARMLEQGGDWGAAADRFRQLADTDRRYRSEHLTHVARLEAQLGRTAEALAAGKALIAAAPGNTSNYETYADLCFRLGQNDEGLDTLRKAIRINPNEPPLMMSLASKLAEQLRTDEAIQLYWQAFEKAESNEDRIGIVIKLTDLHLQLNQFDKLVDRLDRDRREEEKRRSLTICLAQAHHTAGDFGSARQELESLLGRETRDSELLSQLSKLCEAEQDFDSALQFQQQLVRVAPGPETEQRLALLYQSAGLREEASALLLSLAKREEDQGRRLKAIDGLLRNSNYDAASSLIEALLREQPRDWELLYRDALAWASLDRVEEARVRFQRILDMDLPLDSLSRQVQERLKQEQMKAKTNAALGRASSNQSRITPFSAIDRVYEIQRAVGLQADYSYGGGGQPSIYVPSTFGELRMAALGWLLKFENREGRGEEFVANIYKRGTDSAASSKALMDSVYLASLRNDGQTTFQTARRLAATGSQDEQIFFLGSLANRTQSPDQQNYYDNSTKKQDTTPPLSDADLELMLKCLHTASAADQNPNQMAYYRRTMYIANVGRELKRAKRDVAPLMEEIANRKQGADLVAACNWAASEQQLDKALELYDKWSKERLLELGKPGRQQQNRGYDPTQAMIQLMGAKALDKANDDLLRIMDRLLDHSLAASAITRSKETRKASAVRSNRGQQGMQTWYGEQQNYIQLDYPLANDYLDFNSLWALRQVFESFKRNDVASDLAPHLKRRVEVATGLDKVAALQAVAAVMWWNDEKEDAATQFVAAAELVPQDQSLKLDLASMHSALSDFDTALEVVDQIVPRDQKLLQTRELMALQFAERLGDVDRARAAAERLFGVRLDPQQQIALAGYMRRLGLTALADAVTSRAQRSSGNQLAAQMTLMTLYHGQGKTKEAMQLAHQVLRRTTPTMATNSRRNRGGNQNDGFRQQALQFLSQVGQLPEMIERLEKTKSNTQSSSRLSAQLAELYTAAGKRDKALELVAEMVKEQPDDAMAHLQYGQQLEQAGKASEACDQYLLVLKLRPEILADDFYRYGQIFQQANKSVMLAEALETLNLKAVFRSYWNVMNITQPLLQNKETREVGLKLLRRVFKEFVNERQYVFQYIHDEELWNLPEIFEMSKQSIVPAQALTVARPWQGLENIYSYDQDGKVNSSVTRILDSAKRLNRLSELRKEISDRTQGHSDWPAGRAILALIDVKDGKKKEAEEILKELVKDETAMKTLPPMGKWIIAQELEGIPELQDRAIQLLEEAAVSGQMNNEFQYTPYARLVHLYKSANRRDQALKVMRDATKAKSNNNYDRDYETYRRLSTMTSLAEQFIKFDSPVDAISVYRELLSNNSQFAVAARWNGGGDGNQQRRQCEKGLSRALASLKGENASEGIRDLLSSGSNASQGGQLIDLMLIVPDVQDLSKSTMNSAIVELIKAIAKEPELRTSVTQQIEKLAQEHPNDLSLAMMRCLVVGQVDVATARPAIEQLTQLVEKSPLDELESGKRPNARQRTQALHQIPLWLIARNCLQEPALAPLGEKLATRAVAAARRQVDFNFTASILHEWGQVEWKLGRHDAAAEHWSELLDATTVRPKSDRKKASGKGDAPPAPSKGRPVGQRNRTQPHGTRPQNRFAFLLFATIGANPAKDAPKAAPPGSQKSSGKDADSFIPPLTYAQFNSAISVAKLAAEHQLPKLSFRAVEEALKGGPPVPVADGSDSLGSAGNTRVIRSAAPAQPGQLGNVASVTPESFMMVARSLRSLAEIWEKNHFPDDAVYAVLFPQILPPDKPGEIKIYLENDGLTSGRSTSLAATIIPWAQRSHKLAELKQQVTERSQQPTATLNAQVLLTLIALREQDEAAAKASLQKIAAFLEKDKATENQSLACHAAVAGFSKESLREVAAPLLLDCLQGRAAQGNTLDGTFIRELFRYLSSKGETQIVKKRLDEYLAVRQGQNSRYNGDYGLYQQQQDLARTAQVASAGGLVDLALNYIGQANDMPATQYFYGNYEVSKPLYAALRQMLSRTPEERYKQLSEWTLPTDSRKLVRFELTWNRRQDIDPAFLAKSDSDAQTLPGSTLSNFEQLVDAAQACGKLDELLNKVNIAAASSDDIPNAKHLQAFIHLKKNDLAAATPILKELASAVDKRASDARTANRPGPNRCDFLVIRTALEKPELGDLAREYTRLLMGNSKKLQPDLLMHLRIAEANRYVADAGLPPLVPGENPELAYWDSFAPRRLTAYTYPTWWLPVDGSLVHMSGIGDDLLNLRFPITGDFEFSVDAYCNSWAEGNIGYAGINVDALDIGSQTQIHAVDGHETIQRPNPMDRIGQFNRVTVQQREGKVRFLVNHSLVYEETAGSQSPWLNLRTEHPCRVAFSNPQFTGSPIIPREINLIDGDRLDGWLTSQFNETQPQRRVLAEPEDDDSNRGRNRQQYQPPAVYDWEAKDGQLIGNRRDDMGVNVQSRIYYFRPLTNGDRVRYEFRYEPGQIEIHPSIGKVAFLLQPEGVRLHWIADTNWDTDVYGIELTNQSEEPTSTKSSEPLPLKQGDWNAMEVVWQDGSIILLLNGQQIYKRAMTSADLQQFGFFRYKDQSAAQVRNIVLTGDWPTAFPEQLKTSSFAVREPAANEVQQARYAAIGDYFHQFEANTLWRRSLSLNDEERYRALKDWVLPNSRHTYFRLMNFNPPVGREIPAGAHIVTLLNGARFASPCWELIATAQATNQLDDLRKESAAASEHSVLNRRTKWAFQLMLAAATDDEVGVREFAQKLQSTLVAVEYRLPDWALWPEYTATLALVGHPKLHPIAVEFAQSQLDKARKHAEESWLNPRLRPILRTIELHTKDLSTVSQQLTQWQSAPALTAEGRGRGKSPSLWLTNQKGQIEQFPGATIQQLYFQSPLAGDFEVSADVSLPENHEAFLGYAMAGISPFHDQKGVRLFPPNRGEQKIDREFPAGAVNGFANLRMVVKDKQTTWFANGVEMNTTPLPAVADPWLLLRGRSSNDLCTIQNYRILGHPVIPESITLSAVSDLASWRADEYGDSIGQESDHYSPWFPRGDEIVGRLRKDRSSPDQPSSLIYRRPLTFDGQLTYEFYYKEKDFEVHPALGEVCWFIAPDGVRRQKLNNAQWEDDDDRSSIQRLAEVAPTGPKLQLKQDDWNTVRLAWRGNQITLSVNDQDVLREAIEDDNTRQFRLFRFSERNECRVRKMELKGDWPKTLPELSEQELALPATEKTANRN